MWVGLVRVRARLRVRDGMRWAWDGAKCGLACATIAKDMLNMVRI